VSKTPYIYKDPATEYKMYKVDIPQREIKRLLSHRKFGWWQTIDVWVGDENSTYKYYLEYHTRPIAKAINCLLFPLAFFVHGFANYKEIWHDTKRNLFARKYGSFSSDAGWKDDIFYQELLKWRKD